MQSQSIPREEKLGPLGMRIQPVKMTSEGTVQREVAGSGEAKVDAPMVGVADQEAAANVSLPQNSTADCQSTEAGGDSCHASDHIAKEWHQEVTPGFRAMLVRKLITAMTIPGIVQKATYFEDSKARKIEDQIYYQANSRSEYYHLLADKMYSMQMELEEKRKETLEEKIQHESPLKRQQEQQLHSEVSRPSLKVFLITCLLGIFYEFLISPLIFNKVDTYQKDY